MIQVEEPVEEDKEHTLLFIILLMKLLSSIDRYIMILWWKQTQMNHGKQW